MQIILYNSDNFDYFLENDINKNLNYLCCFQANKLNISSQCDRMNIHVSEKNIVLEAIPSFINEMK